MRKSKINNSVFPQDIRMSPIRKRKLHKLAFVLTCLSLSTSAYHLYPIYKQFNPPSQVKVTSIKGIIIKENAILYQIPSTLSKNRSINISSGIEVIITNSTDGWYQIKIPEGNYWVESTSLMLEKHI